VVGDAFAASRGFQHQAELGLHAFLTDEFLEGGGAQRSVDE